MTTVNADETRDVEEAVASWAGLPTLRCKLGAGAVLERLRTASKRGRLPGFREVPGGFAVELFGVPWDRELQGRVVESSVGGVDGAEVRWRRRDKRGMQALWAVVLVLSVWPGVVLADKFIPSDWGWIGTHVWHWYMPLTVVSNAWAWWWAVRKTEQTTLASAVEAVAIVGKELGAGVEAEARAAGVPA